MKIGILQCDDVMDELQIDHGNYPTMFEQLLHQVDETLEFKLFRALDGELPDNIDRCDVYLITGSKYGVNDDLPWIAPLIEFVQQLYQKGKRVVGICFGHQLIVKALGGEVVQAEQGWGVGVATHKLNSLPLGVKSDKQMEDVSLLVSHQDQVITLPEETKVLAGNDFCPYAMIQVGHHFLGIQGHPEFNKQFLQDLLMLRREILPAEVLENGMQSLTKSVDSDKVACWMIDFLKT